MKIKNETIAGIVLAAGKGKRIGSNKAIVRLNGVSFLKIVTSCLQETGCSPVIVVVGSNAETVKHHTHNLNVDFVLNKNWQDGQFSSLKAGLSRLDSNVAGVLVALVDHPLVALNTYRLLLKNFRDFPNKIIIPLYNSKQGHPIILPKAIIREALQSPDNLNLREVFHHHQEMVFRLEVNDPGILKDINTITDLRRAVKY